MAVSRRAPRHGAWALLNCRQRGSAGCTCRDARRSRHSVTRAGARRAVEVMKRLLLGVTMVVAAGVLDPGRAAEASPDRFDGASAIVLCNADATCTGGAKCIDGRCTPPSELCADATQCVVAGEACVNGVCVPRCSGATPCPGGYDCDYTRGVCQSSLTGCVTNGQCRPC